MMNKLNACIKPLVVSFFPLTLLAAGIAQAQTTPDTGRVLQQLPAPVVAPLPEHDTGLAIEAAPLTELPPGGDQLLLGGVAFSGNTRFSDEELLVLLADALGQSLDLAGLQSLANRISEHYRRQGYPFARAYLPPQEVADGGVLQIRVLEGRYGQVKVEGDPEQVEGLTPYLAPLQPGELIDAAQMERSILLMSDLPGSRVAPIMRPGQQRGEGDLVVRALDEPRYHLELGLDNHGNRYTGNWRTHAEIRANRLLVMGDELALRGMYTEEGMWLGRLSWSRPLGVSGLRGQVSAARTDYELGRELASSGIRGQADVFGVTVTYPLHRSQQSNLLLSGGYQYKALDTYIPSLGNDEKSSHALPLTLQFDRRDAWGGGGLFYGSLSWTPGHLTLDAADADSLNTAGLFHKVSLELTRLQRIDERYTLFGRLASQWTSGNLDSSEGFSLGGANAVRAYPSGEAAGDLGWFVQSELRYSLTEQWTPYLFVDAGGVRVNASPTVSSGDPSRHLSGAGPGVRFSQGRWSFDTSLAWRISGEEAEAEGKDRNLHFWFSTTYQFAAPVTPWQERMTERPLLPEVVSTPAVAAIEVEDAGRPDMDQQAVLLAGVLFSLDAWANAWRDRDPAGYLILYAETFRSADGLDPARWERQRYVRLSQPDFIELELKSLVVVFEGDQRAIATFDQGYESNRYSSRVRKELVLEHNPYAGWLIVSERILARY
ncbi:ShlB/FhaC/HecB family hemolysin secretion/activation protein [Marinospirillum sp.]|uniref:ShlB/FhaC/HecB family hemolysin secretion/activation protein n=1 Tax=Marinospirillum sp. TaxID=2183934 RepID=UPI0025C105E9|nr:ShlB/FhaC/HecB family hemolysin secretion/activation protein [Marinospirillum sp.]